MKNQPGTIKNHGNQPKTMKNPETGISKNVTNFRYRRGVTTDLGGGQGRNKQKRYRHKT